MSALFWTLAGVAFLLLVLYFLFCALLVNKFLRRKPDDPEAFLRRMERGPNARYFKIIRDSLGWFPAQPAEDVYVESMDGLTLHGRYLSREHPRGTMLLVHGFHGSGNCDFSCVLQTYYDMGFDLLVIDQRSHLGSQGTFLTMGVLERYDVRSWCLWLLERFGEQHPVVLDGISMGGATVLMSAGLELPENVKGILADCPYTTPKAIIRKVAKDMGIPPALIYPFVRLGGLLFAGGIDPADASALVGVEGATVPITVIHGEADAFVPADMSREIKKANPAIDLQLFPGAHHGISYMKDKPRYLSLVTDFALKCLK